MPKMQKLLLLTSAALLGIVATAGSATSRRAISSPRFQAVTGDSGAWGARRERARAARAERVAASAGRAADLSSTQTLTLDVGGFKRSALVQLPDRPRGLLPVVIALHGGTREASDILERTSWPEVAKREGILLVAPQGENNQWNDGRGSTISGRQSTANDVAFLAALIATLVSEHGADPNAIFVTGVSNGGLMTMRLACEQPGLVAAIAPVISTLPQALTKSCQTAAPVAALFMAGTADPLMTYDGKPSAMLERRGTSAPMLSMPATLELWRLRNRCEDKGGAQDLPDINKLDQSTVTRIEYRPCKSGAPVVHYRINGGGHQMPSLKPQQLSPQFAKLLGPQNSDIEGTEEIWRFFAARIKR
jgi:polyhydroxybutyrate depolymerase